MSRSQQKDAEELAYQTVRSTPLTHFPGRLVRRNYWAIRDEAIIILSQPDTVFAECQDRGFIGELTSVAEFATITGQNDPYVAPPDTEDQYDPAILATMSDAVRKRREAAWSDKLISIATRTGTLRGLTENFRDAIDKRYYEDLEDKYTGYKNVTIRQFFNELDTVWLKKCLESDEETEEHYLRDVTFGQDHTVSKFAKDLDQEQVDVARDDIVITDAKKKHHFLIQIKTARLFTAEEWKVYNKKSAADRSWALTKTYFKELEMDNEELAQAERALEIRGGGYASANAVQETEAAIDREQNEAALVLLKEIAEKENTNTAAANAVIESQAKMMKDMQAMMTKMQTEMTALKARPAAAAKPPPNRGGTENANPNTPAFVPGPPCKYCGKQHGNIPDHWMGTEANCPGKDWPSNIVGSACENNQWFIDRMNKRTGKEYKK